jgi:hypothetical protein
LAEVHVERRKIGSEREARRCLTAVKGSGLSLKEWARSRGIDGRSLHAWQMNLERWSGQSAGKRPRAKKATSSRMRLVELVASSATSSSRYVVRVGSVSVEFGDDFEDGTLRRVVEVLRSC